MSWKTYTLLVILIFFNQYRACPYPLTPSLKYTLLNVSMRQTVVADVIKVLDNFDGMTITVDKQFLPQLCCDMMNLGHRIKEIIFRAGSIGYIEATCFSRSVQNVMERIDFSFNALTSIKSSTFKHLEIAELWLSDNFIATLGDGAFFNLTKLRMLSLEKNNLQVLNSEAFSSLSSLQSLYLGHNCIRNLQRGALNFLARDAVVSLNCNQIIQIGNFLEGISLKIKLNLELNGNKIESFSGNIVENRTFQILNLANNPLKNISAVLSSAKIDRLEFFCGYLSLKDVQSVVNWAKARGILLLTNRCSQYNISFGLASSTISCSSTRMALNSNNYYLLYLSIFLVVNEI
ncbi:hypothetical protein Zmor_022219 [Zophobas morio]|uniref:Uncharacterized protein n=1 Tax=Zophobas morio TaxID=2755281 RepID=A0AA38HW80_9CUCU|nr:hypothetical protein Zmor_022219 [Zophobas morio]